VPLKVETSFSRSAALERHLATAKGRGAAGLMAQLSTAVTEDNRAARLRGVDRYGVPLAPLRSERKGKYKGKTGPPLAPSGAASRVVTHFRVQTSRTAAGWVLLAGWDDVVSARGVPFLPFHLQGKGRNPVRNIGGITPQGWRSAILPIFHAFTRGRS
jgi:hypothetical protein